MTGEPVAGWRLGSRTLKAEGVNVVETLICNLEPDDDDALEALRECGAKLSA